MNMIKRTQNLYRTSMEKRIANYFAKAYPGLSSAAENDLVSMIMDVAKLLEKWDYLVEDQTRRILRSELVRTKVEDNPEVKRIQSLILSRIEKQRRLERESLIPSGTVDRQLLIAKDLLASTNRHFSDEISLLQDTKNFCLSRESARNSEQILERARNLQYEKSIAYVTDLDFALSLRPRELLPKSKGLLDIWAFVHECVHDIREWKHDLNNSIFNYFLILVSLNLPDADKRKRFFEGYMLTDDHAKKKRCVEVFQKQRKHIENEWKDLNTEMDVIRTFLDDLLTGAFDITSKNLDLHITR